MYRKNATNHTESFVWIVYWLLNACTFFLKFQQKTNRLNTTVKSHLVLRRKSSKLSLILAHPICGFHRRIVNSPILPAWHTTNTMPNHRQPTKRTERNSKFAMDLAAYLVICQLIRLTWVNYTSHTFKIRFIEKKFPSFFIITKIKL